MVLVQLVMAVDTLSTLLYFFEMHSGTDEVSYGKRLFRRSNHAQPEPGPGPRCRCKARRVQETTVLPPNTKKKLKQVCTKKDKGPCVIEECILRAQCLFRSDSDIKKT